MTYNFPNKEKNIKELNQNRGAKRNGIKFSIILRFSSILSKHNIMRFK